MDQCVCCLLRTLNANVKYMCEYEFQKNRDDAWFGFSSTAVVWTDKLCVSADEGPEAFVCVCVSFMFQSKPYFLLLFHGTTLAVLAPCEVPQSFGKYFATFASPARADPCASLLRRRGCAFCRWPFADPWLVLMLQCVCARVCVYFSVCC